MSVRDYRQATRKPYKVRTYRNPDYELRGVYEQANGKTRLFWRAYMLQPFVCPVTDICKSTDHRAVAEDLTAFLRGAPR